MLNFKLFVPKFLFPNFFFSNFFGRGQGAIFLGGGTTPYHPPVPMYAHHHGLALLLKSNINEQEFIIVLASCGNYLLNNKSFSPVG
jgi:hypothetical protein